MDGDILASYNYSKMLDYVFTQQYVWETLGQTNATFRNADLQSQYESFKVTIDNQIAQMQKQPSFIYDTIELDVGTTKTITDTNYVLSEYPNLDKTVDGIRIVHNKGENTLTITVNDNCAKETYVISESTMKSWGMIREGTDDKDTTIFFTFKEGVQNQLYSMHYNDPVPMMLDLKINLTGSLEISKLNQSSNLIDGSKFEISGNNYTNQVEVKNGKITIDNLKKGTYTIKEIAAPYRISIRY